MKILYGTSLNDGIKIGKLFFYSKEKRNATLSTIKEAIIIADALTPNDTVKFNKKRIVAFVVNKATAYSHVAILSRTMNLPAVSNICCSEQWNGKNAIVDGMNGILIVEPDEHTLQFYKKRIEDNRTESNGILKEYKNRSAITQSGKQIHIYANINALEEVDDALLFGAEGVGVFKTEFVYLNSSNLPSEDEQFIAYKEMAKKLGKKKLIIRTFDIGVDKVPEYIRLPKEENPALGYRGIRLCLNELKLFKTQLRAILRASVYGNVSIMYPMIVSVDEIHRIKKLIKELMNELSNEKIAFNDSIEQGIMIETPAAVLMSEELAREVNFFSIGTNDLTQYTLAVDRQNPLVEDLYDSHHPSILRSIQIVINNAKKAGIWTSISGELGADLSLTKKLIDYGIDALTVSPSKILPLKKEICNLK